MLPVLPPAILALADGTVFSGTSIGAPGHTVGEVVFNTALTGYQEILTDPSYCRQIVTLTYPHVGSYGISEEDVEYAAAQLEPNSSAALLIWEDLWAAPFARAVRDSGGVLLDGARIPHELIEPALSALPPAV